jgi:hypothetical protein
MTAIAIVLMRQNNVPVKDERIQRGIAWLKTRAARERPLVDALALSRELPLHHLHRHLPGIEGTGDV